MRNCALRGPRSLQKNYKATISENTAVTGQLHDKHILLATDCHATDRNLVTQPDNRRLRRHLPSDLSLNFSL
jgi:hypothetical protein